MLPVPMRAPTAASVGALLLALALGGCGQPSSLAARTEAEAQALAAAPKAAPEPVAQSEAPPPPPDLSGAAQVKVMIGMKGDCTLLVIADEPAPRCEGSMMNVTYRSGRSSFQFFDPVESRMVSFTGMSGRDVRHGDSIVQPLDGVTFTRTVDGASKSETIRAVGSCRHTNPFTGVGTVSCQAESASGRWAAEFRTDGKPPTMEEFD